MPKATRSSTSKVTSRTDPLTTKSANTTKKPRTTSPKNSTRKTETASTQNNNAPSKGTAKSSPKHRPVAAAEDPELNYLFMVSNTLTDDPIITRLLSVPPSLTFGKFHQVLQAAFGWADCHMHTFSADIPTHHHSHKAHNQKLCIPKRVLNLQAGGDDGMDFGTRPAPQDENEWTLRDALEKKEWDGDNVASPAEIKLLYRYDMGDDWEHQINFLGRADRGLHSALTGLPGEKAQKVLCIAGEGHPCAEDCGSGSRWQGLKDAFTRPRRDKDLKEWYKNQCTNGDPKGLDPWKWDILDVNEKLECIEA